VRWVLPPLPDPGAARDAARDELSRAAYDRAKPSLATRVVSYLLRRLQELLSNAAGSVPGGKVGLLLIVLIVVAVAVLVIVRLRPSLRDAFRDDLFGEGAALTAAEHRQRADDAAARGDFAEAVRERLRAVVRDLEQRGVLDPRPGRTADEVAREAGAAVPALAEPLRRAATVFDEVWYGGRTADATSYAALLEVDALISSVRLVVA
jgi:hypothetical protein